MITCHDLCDYRVGVVFGEPVEYGYFTGERTVGTPVKGFEGALGGAVGDDLAWDE